MRLALTFSPNTSPIPFAYQQGLVNRFRAWSALQSHSIALHGFGWLDGSQAVQGALECPQGARWQIGAWDEDVLRQVVKNCPAGTELFCGMRMERAEWVRPPAFPGRETRFNFASPILVRDNPVGGHDDHLTFDDPLADSILTTSLQHRLDAAGLHDHAAEASIRLARDWRGAKTKMVQVEGGNWRANACPVIVTGSATVREFTWSVGVGNRTGLGFGWLGLR